MKKSILFFLLLISLTYTGCGTLDKFDHFGIGNTFNQSFTISVPAGASQSFVGSVEFAASDDATIEDNIKNIKEFDVSRISLKITKYTGDNSVVANGSVTITSNGLVVGTPVTINNLNFSQLASSDQEVLLPLSTATFSAIKDAYLNNQTLTIEAAGDVSDLANPIEVEFTIYMSIDATINNK